MDTDLLPPGRKPDQSPFSKAMEKAGASPKAAMLETIGRFVAEQVKKATDPLNARIMALEAKPELKYCGVWSTDKVYAEGSFVTDAGSVWYAKRATVGDRPNQGDTWQLAVKRGKDGR